MPSPDLIEFLRGLHFLREVDEATLTELAPSLVQQEFGPGELILRQGAFPKALVLIAEGEAGVFWAEPEAPPVELYRLGVGDTFGELELAYEETYHGSLTAVAPTTVYFWEQGSLEAGLKDFPTALAGLRYIAQSRRLALRLRFDWLGAGETVCGLSRKDPNLLLQALTVPLALTLGGLASLWWGAGSPLAWIGGGLLILGLGLAAWRWFDWRNDYYIVTNQRVVWLEKVIGLYDSRQESPLHMLLSVTVSTDFTGRTLGYGDVILRTYTGQITFRAVNDPHSMAAIIEERRHRVQGEREQEDREVVAAALRRRLEEGGGEGEAAVPVQPAHSNREPDRTKQAIGLDHWTFEVRFEQGGVITYRKHWAVLLRFIALPSITVLLVVGALGAGLGGLLRIFSFEADLIAGLLLLVPAFGWWVYQFMDWANDLYQITADQILDVYKKPLARELRKIAPLENILGTQVKRKGIVGLLLNYGDVIAQVGTEEFSFEGVFEPNRVQQDIVRAQEALVERRRELERQQRRAELAEWFGVYHEESRQRQGEEALRLARMGTRQIVTAPNPVLREKAKRVKSITPEVQRLIDDMVETMHQAPGVGLAAPQVGVSQRVIVVEVAEGSEDGGGAEGAEEAEGAEPRPTKLYALVNPEITRHSGELEPGTEGCLSIPGYLGEVERFSWATVKGLDRHGKPFKLKVRGWPARVFQHEIDHLDGVLFIDRAKRLWKVEPEEEQATPAV